MTFPLIPQRDLFLLSEVIIVGWTTAHGLIVSGRKPFRPRPLGEEVSRLYQFLNGRTLRKNEPLYLPITG
jgi:hypothetical protein